MDSSSDSSFVDEELCIRPPEGSSIETIKTWLLKDFPHARIIRRNTFSGMNTLSGDFLAAECSEYFTSDSAMSKPNACFLEKMKAVLDEPCSANTSYQTGHDQTANTIKTRRSSLPRLDISDICDLETLTLSHQFRDNIVISDDEIDDDFLRNEGTQIKYENISAVEIDDGNEETDNSFTNGKCDMENKMLYVAPEKEECNCKSYEDLLTAPDGKDYLYTNKMNKDVVEDCYSAACSSYSSSSVQHSSSGYQRKEFLQVPSALPRKQDSATTPTSARKKALESKKRGEERGANCNFQTVTKPVRKVVDKFEHILSPVRFYIKHSTTSPINRHVKALKQPIVLPDDFYDDVPDLSHRWEFTIPEVIYRPGAKKYGSPIKDIELPQDIQERVPRVTNMYVAKHEARSKRAVNQEDVRRELNENLDLTRRGAESEPQDISIICIKTPFSK